MRRKATRTKVGISGGNQDLKQGIDELRISVWSTSEKIKSMISKKRLRNQNYQFLTATYAQ